MIDYLICVAGYAFIGIVSIGAWVFLGEAAGLSKDIIGSGVIAVILFQSVISGVRKIFGTSFWGAYREFFRLVAMQVGLAGKETPKDKDA